MNQPNNNQPNNNNKMDQDDNIPIDEPIEKINPDDVYEEIEIDKGNPDQTRLQLIIYAPIHNHYYNIGEKVGIVFHDGLQLKNNK